MSTSVGTVLGFFLVLGGAVATARAACRGAALAAGIAAFACAAVLAWTEASQALRPSTWLLSIALALAVLSQALRLEREDFNQERSEVR